MAHIERRAGRKKQYRVIWKDKFTGNKRNKSFPLRKEAQAFLETLGSTDNTLAQSHPDMSVGQSLERWYDLSITTGRGGREPVGTSTSSKYLLHKTIIDEFIGHLILCELTKRQCNDFRDKLLLQYSRPYAKKILTSFKSALNQAVTDEVLLSSPAHDTSIIISKRLAIANRTPIPTLDEIRLLTNSIDQLMRSNNQQKAEAWARYGVLFYTMLYSGFRPIELRGLAWREIDWDRNQIRASQGADVSGNIVPLKSAASYRVVPMPDFVMEKLKNWKVRCPTSADDLVFPNGKGNPESHSNITNRGWYVLCEKAGLVHQNVDGKLTAKYPLYSLRHVKASVEIALKRSPKHIQTVMGHANIQMTFDTYGHLFDDKSLQDDPNDMDKLLRMNPQRTPRKSQTSDIII